MAQNKVKLHRGRERFSFLFLSLIFVFFSFIFFSSSAIGSVAKEKGKEEIFNKISLLQIPFIENKGQVDGQVKYYAPTFGGTVFITGDGKVVYSLPRLNEEKAEKKEAKGWVIKESLIGASISRVKGEERASAKINYFKGENPVEWKKNLSTYDLVSLEDVYQGIELKLKAYERNVEKLFYIKPKANPESIKVKIDGTSGLKVNKEGELEVKTGLGVVKFTKPVAYQEENGKRKYIEAAYVAKGNEYGFKVGKYDQTQMLIIDPLLASTFLGGSIIDWGRFIDTDSSGNVYVAGYTTSSNFPTTPGAYDATINGSYDTFVSKFDSNLHTLLASTFLGGSSSDRTFSMIIDNSGNVCITGDTSSSDFPTTPGAYDATYNGGSTDVFISKLDSTLQTLLASTFLGGNSIDYAYGIAVDSSGNIYVVGDPRSLDFPTTSGAYDTTYNGGNYDVFISKFNSSLSTLLASTFFGGSSNDYAYSIVIDSSGNIYVAGDTTSSDLPTTANAYDPTYNGNYDAFIAKFDSTLQTLLASTFLGGISSDYARSIDIGIGGNVYVAGDTNSSNFPTTAGAYDSIYNGVYDAFVSKFDNTLQTLLASTFLGGSATEHCYSIAIDSSMGDVYVTGDTISSDFPVTNGAYDSTLNGSIDVFISRIDKDLHSLLASTFLGGINSDYGYSIAIDNSSGNVYVIGVTNSSNFPVTAGAYNTVPNDIFISKFDKTISKVKVTANKTTVNEGEGVTFTGSYTCRGSCTTLWNFGDGTTDGTGTITPTHVYKDNGVYSATLTVTDDDGVGSDSVSITVNNVAPTIISINAPIAPVQCGTLITANATFTDPGADDTHIAQWEWGDTSSSWGTVTEPYGSNPGTVIGTHTYSAADVYTITLHVWDDDGGETSRTLQYVVVYDTQGGYVTGNGLINSPLGAYVVNPLLTGTAKFTFLSRYLRKTDTIPSGTTKFIFYTANFTFASTSYQWLVVSGAKAQYKGSGTINGTGDYGFKLFAIDGNLKNIPVVDKFRIKIWDKGTDAIIYDNELNADDNSDPTTAITGGSIIINK